MLSGKAQVLEVGCGDAFGSRLVQQEVEKLTALDFDPIFLDNIKSRRDEKWPMETIQHDATKAPIPGKFEAIYSLDVIEHISKELENQFIENILSALDSNGTLIIGCPSLESQQHASPASKIGHINCKSGSELKALMEDYFHNVFLFSMNDEVVHTGFSPMAHYIFVLCCAKKNQPK